jgi:methylenetetrahydrofolate reductase (NADPH)
VGLADHYRLVRDGSRRGLSFEFFPPKTADGLEALFQHVAKLDEFEPDFFTCTYGAGGSSRQATLEIVSQLKLRFSRPVASHLTCVGSTIEEIRGYLRQASARSIDYIVALRGDPPKGQTQFQAVDGGLRHANELVSLIRREFPDFGIAVAGYPEVHQEATSAESDLTYLKQKVDCGADVIITQLFYNNEDFLRFRDRCVQAGIRIPIIPGILPVTNLGQIQRIASLCKAGLPAELIDRLSQNDDPQWQYQVGVDFATRQSLELCEQDVPGLHFYVLNKSQATIEVLSALPRGTGFQPVA